MSAAAPPPPLPPAAGAALLALARRAAGAAAAGAPPPALPEDPALAPPRGAFVTLTVDGELRGCIGSFSPAGSLARTVADMARAAAVEDPRFDPLRPDELPRLGVHISVLGLRRRMTDPSELVIGRDGVLVSRGWHRGTLLPRVAVEEGWDAATFLARTCLKAGLPPRDWQQPDAVVELYGAEELDDPAPAAG